jgi:plastocyanin
MLATGLSLGAAAGLAPPNFGAAPVAEAHGKGPQSDLRLALNQLLAGYATRAASGAAEDTAEVSIKLFQFQPNTIEVKAGTTIG